MGYRLMQLAADVEATAVGLSATEKLLLLTLCRFSDDQGGSCYPSRATLVALTGLSLPTVKDKIQSLEAAGWMRTEQNPGKPRYFFINIERLTSAAAACGEVEPCSETGEEIDPGKNLTGAKNYPGKNLAGSNSLPGKKVSPRGAKNLAGRGLKSYPRKEQLKDQLKEQESNTAFSLEPRAHVHPRAEVQGVEGTPVDGELFPDKPKRETAKRLASTLQKPEGVSPELWGEWVAFKKKRCKSCTPRMVKHLCDEAAKAGITPEGAMTIQLERGWAGFEADYINNSSRGRFSGSRTAPVEIPFDQRDYNEGINDDNTF